MRYRHSAPNSTADVQMGRLRLEGPATASEAATFGPSVSIDSLRSFPFCVAQRQLAQTPKADVHRAHIRSNNEGGSPAHLS